MKFYSEELKQLFDTQEALKKAEAEVKAKAVQEKLAKEKKEAERKARAKEVEDARKAMIDARAKYAKLLEAFTRDYNSYHLSLNGEDAKRAIPSMFDIFNPLFFDI